MGHFLSTHWLLKINIHLPVESIELSLLPQRLDGCGVNIALCPGSFWMQHNSIILSRLLLGEIHKNLQGHRNIRMDQNGCSDLEKCDSQCKWRTLENEKECSMISWNHWLYRKMKQTAAQKWSQKIWSPPAGWLQYSSQNPPLSHYQMWHEAN